MTVYLQFDIHQSTLSLLHIHIAYSTWHIRRTPAYATPLFGGLFDPAHHTEDPAKPFPLNHLHLSSFASPALFISRRLPALNPFQRLERPATAWQRVSCFCRLWYQKTDRGPRAGNHWFLTSNALLWEVTDPRKEMTKAARDEGSHWEW